MKYCAFVLLFLACCADSTNTKTPNSMGIKFLFQCGDSDPFACNLKDCDNVSSFYESIKEKISACQNNYSVWVDVDESLLDKQGFIIWIELTRNTLKFIKNKEEASVTEGSLQHMIEVVSRIENKF